MPANELIDTVGSRVRDGAHVRSAFGDPVSSGEVTIVPVALTFGGFGAGGGPHGEGGGGGGMSAVPLGFVEVRPTGARYVPFWRPEQWLLAAGAGLLLGWWLGRRRA